MAFKHGSKTAVWLDSRDLSPYLTSADLSVDADTADTTTLGSSWKSAIAGTFGAKVSCAGLYDPTMTDLESSLGVDFSLTAGVLTIAQGTDIDSRARLVSVSTSGYAQSSPVGGVIAVKWDAMTSTAVGFGDVLHAWTTDTNTTTGAEDDDLAATSTGWTAHLHVSAISGGSWVIKIQDAAVSNTYSDLSGASFTAVTGAGKQRLLAASATATVRRYIRYVATRTGGVAGDSITFALAFARNQ